MTENQVLAGHTVADYENGVITEEQAVEKLEQYQEADEKAGYPTDEIEAYLDDIKYS